MDNPSHKKDVKEFKTMKKTFEKGIYAKVDINKGENISLDNLAFLKPLSKIHSADYKKVLNKKASKKIKKGQALNWSQFL